MNVTTYLTTSGIARRLDVCEPTVRHRIKLGLLAADARLGRQALFLDTTERLKEIRMAVRSPYLAAVKLALAPVDRQPVVA